MIVLEEEFFTPQEVADKLRVDLETVMRWLRKHDLGGYHVGRQWRISHTDYQQFLDEGRNIKEEE
jgi:excisionase family DNA binding protein